MNQQPFEPSQITFASGSRESHLVFQEKSPFYDILALISVMSHPALPHAQNFPLSPVSVFFKQISSVRVDTLAFSYKRIQI